MVIQHKRLVMPVSHRDAKLQALGLQLNAEVGDSQPITAAERRVKEQLADTLGDEINRASDFLILKTIRGYAGYEDQVKTTAEALRQIICWRAENAIDTVLDREIKHEQEAMKGWPSRVYGEDYQGHIINCERLADIDVAAIGKLDLKDVLVARAKTAEMIDVLKARIAADIGYPRMKQIFIVDLTGLVLSKHFSKRAREVMKPVFAQNDAMYPDSLHTLYVVNAPFIFRTAWGIIKRWLDPLTVQKIVILGNQSQYLPILQEAGMPLDQLPVWCGGSHEGIDIYDLCQAHRKEIEGAGASAGSSAAAGAADVDTAEQARRSLEEDLYDLCQAHCKKPLANPAKAERHEKEASQATSFSRRPSATAAKLVAGAGPLSAGELE